MPTGQIWLLVTVTDTFHTQRRSIGSDRSLMLLTITWIPLPLNFAVSWFVGKAPGISTSVLLVHRWLPRGDTWHSPGLSALLR